MEKFAGTTTYITLKSNHTSRCPVYVLDGRFQGNIYGIPMGEPLSRAGIFLGHSPFHAVPVALVINQETGNISPKFHVAFDDKFPQFHS